MLVVALTMNDSEDDKEACKSEGIAAYGTKPLKEIDLVVIIKKSFKKGLNCVYYYVAVRVFLYLCWMTFEMFLFCGWNEMDPF